MNDSQRASDRSPRRGTEAGYRLASASGKPVGLLLSTPRERAAYAAGRRVRLLYTSLLVVAAAAAGAWYAGTRIQSPAEMAARVAPPAPSPILVPVEEKVLSADVVTARHGPLWSAPAVSLAPSPLKAGPGRDHHPANPQYAAS